MAVQVDNLLLSEIGRSISLDTASRLREAAMSKLIRQVSIEAPAPKIKDSVFNLVVPVPDTPPHGARILVVYAGACYRKNQSTSISSISSQISDTGDITTSLSILAKQMQGGICSSISEEGPDSSPAQAHQTSVAIQHFYTPTTKDKIQITVASLRDEGFVMAKKCEKVNVVQWNEDLYEKQLIERTHDACEGLVDIVIDFGSTSRSLHRSMQCLTKGGHVLISDEIADKLLAKFAKRAEDRGVFIEVIPTGTIEQLHQVVKLVASNEIEPPPHTVFPSDQAAEVVRKLASSEIPGRAILKFHDVE